VTVVADTAAEADALSTALFVLGPERGVEFCNKHPEFSAIFVLPGDRAQSIQIETCNLDEDECTYLQP
jgi:thiamine biosynthesis lipoprotein